MNDRSLLGAWVRRFLLEYLVAERNLARNTQASYRDTLTLLLPFASSRGGHPIDRMTVENLTPAIVRQFLDYLECERPQRCHSQTAAQRLAIRAHSRQGEQTSVVLLVACQQGSKRRHC